MKKTFFVFILSIFVLSGCSILNPYKSDFSCPDYDKGKCIQVEDAYKESVKGRGAAINSAERDKACRQCLAEAKKRDLPEEAYCSSCYNRPEGAKGVAYDLENGKTETLYQKEVNKKLTAMLKQPNTPLIAPPKVMRVLMLPYKGDLNELYMMRYVYLMTDDPRWVIGDYLIEKED